MIGTGRTSARYVVMDDDRGRVVAGPYGWREALRVQDALQRRARKPLRVVPCAGTGLAARARIRRERA